MPIRRPFWLSSTHLKFVFAVGILVLLLVAILLGRGISANPYTGEVKVELKATPPSEIKAETFGAGSSISAEKGASTETSIRKTVLQAASKPVAEPGHSAAKYVTHGDASPIAVGPETRASATLDLR